MPSKYINEATVRTLLKEFNVRYPIIENFFKEPALIDILAEKTIRAIDEFKEDMYYRCDSPRGKMFKPLILSRTKDNATFIYQSKAILDVCKNDHHSALHYHGIYPGVPSMTDENTHELLFSDGAQDGIIAGIDGIHITTFLNHRVKIPWTPAFYQEVTRHGHVVKDDVQNVVCKRQEKPFMVECAVYQGNRMDKQVFALQQVIAEDPILTGKANPFRWMDKGHGDGATYHFDYGESRGKCVIMQDRQRDIRVMTCFKNIIVPPSSK